VLATTSVLGGRYLLGPLLGRGGVADVYRAEDRASGVPVAVKVLRNATTADLRRFEREARTLERLDHPAIVHLCDEGEHEGVPYLVLDLVDGEPLSSVIERAPMDEHDVQRMGGALAGALAHAHRLGIVHRDVKPSNVLVDRDRSAHLSDFGIARLADSAALTALTETGLVIGTAAYLAPEQVRGEYAGPESDVFSLGLVLVEALTGKRAYAGPPAEAAVARLQRPPEIPALTPWLRSLLTAMTAIDPSRRPRAAAVEDAFANPSATGEHTAIMPVSPPLSTAPARTPSGRRRPLLLALVGVVAALALVAVMLAGNRSGEPTGPAGPSTTTTTTATTVPQTSPSAVTTPPATAPKAGPSPAHGKGKHGGPGSGDG
jgi:eukaryotic-like serine/threonine-protein kinase